MIFIFYFLAAVLVFLSFKSFRGGIQYLRFFKSALASPLPGYTPFATVIVPCRGVDEGLLQNLMAVTHQEYGNYEVIFVTDDPLDPAVAVVDEAIRDSPVETVLIIAERATVSSQKVDNLRAAVHHADASSSIFVFADSDVRPSTLWLRHLVAPLADEQVGAATGYRWFISHKPTFASELLAAWNASIASSLGPDTRSNFCWGGSMAIRRETFERLDIREKWHGTLSDDFTVTLAMNAAHLPIVFVPQALSPSMDSSSLAQVLEFTTRQMKITRVYAPKLWIVSLIGSALFIIVLTTALRMIIFGSPNQIAFTAAVATVLLVTVLSLAKAYLRFAAVKLVLAERYPEVRRQTLAQHTLWLITPGLFLYNSLAALASRRLTWRGTTYELKSPHETVIIAD
ncbi:MAG: glycosyltransferase family 2 protein [Pyrinomonadaceae bacterium]